MGLGESSGNSGDDARQYALALGLLQAGSNMAAENRPRYGYAAPSAAQLFSTGAGGFAQGAGNAGAWQAQQRQAREAAAGRGRTVETGVPSLAEASLTAADAVTRQRQPMAAGAASPRGRQGSRLRPETDRETADKLGIENYDPMNEERNVAVSTVYLEELADKYNTPELTVMAYDWGPGNVDKWLKEGKDWSKVPAETINYVGKVLGRTFGADRAEAATPAPREAEKKSAATDFRWNPQTNTLETS